MTHKHTADYEIETPDAAGLDMAIQAYFATVESAFWEATREVTQDFHYHLMGITITTRYAGASSTLARQLTPALRHAVTPILPMIDGTDLTVLLWDTATSGVALPKIPWEYYPDMYAPDYGTQGEIRAFNTARFGTLHNSWAGQIVMIDRKRRLALCWFADAEALPWWDAAFPLRAALHLYSIPRPLQLMHSAAVGLDSGGVLITGVSGSGKSTTALSCYGSALKFAGDDYVAVHHDTASNSAPIIHNLYGIAKLVPDNIQRFPHLDSLISNRDSLHAQKAMLFLDDPTHLGTGFPLKAILHPKITGKRGTQIVPGARGQALFALAPTTMFQLIASKRVIFNKLRRLIRSVPVYTIEVGTDLDQIPATIHHFLRDFSGSDIDSR